MPSMGRRQAHEEAQRAHAEAQANLEKAQKAQTDAGAQAGEPSGSGSTDATDTLAGLKRAVTDAHESVSQKKTKLDEERGKLSRRCPSCAMRFPYPRSSTTACGVLAADVVFRRIGTVEQQVELLKQGVARDIGAISAVSTGLRDQMAMRRAQLAAAAGDLEDANEKVATLKESISEIESPEGQSAAANEASGSGTDRLGMLKKQLEKAQEHVADASHKIEFYSRDENDDYLHNEIARMKAFERTMTKKTNGGTTRVKAVKNKLSDVGKELEKVKGRLGLEGKKVEGEGAEVNETQTAGKGKEVAGKGKEREVAETAEVRQEPRIQLKAIDALTQLSTAHTLAVATGAPGFDLGQLSASGGALIKKLKEIAEQLPGDDIKAERALPNAAAIEMISRSLAQVTGGNIAEATQLADALTAHPLSHWVPLPKTSLGTDGPDDEADNEPGPSTRPVAPGPAVSHEAPSEVMEKLFQHMAGVPRGLDALNLAVGQPADDSPEQAPLDRGQCEALQCYWQAHKAQGKEPLPEVKAWLGEAMDAAAHRVRDGKADLTGLPAKQQAAFNAVRNGFLSNAANSDYDFSQRNLLSLLDTIDAREAPRRSRLTWASLHPAHDASPVDRKVLKLAERQMETQGMPTMKTKVDAEIATTFSTLTKEARQYLSSPDKKGGPVKTRADIALGAAIVALGERVAQPRAPGFERAFAYSCSPAEVQVGRQQHPPHEGRHPPPTFDVEAARRERTPIQREPRSEGHPAGTQDLRRSDEDARQGRHGRGTEAARGPGGIVHPETRAGRRAVENAEQRAQGFVRRGGFNEVLARDPEGAVRAGHRRRAAGARRGLATSGAR
ncbi:MAG: hypothetical protein WDN30_05380 [Pararobbsia sp.]